MQKSKTGFCTSNFHQPRQVLHMQKYSLPASTFGTKGELMVPVRALSIIVLLKHCTVQKGLFLTKTSYKNVVLAE